MTLADFSVLICVSVSALAIWHQLRWQVAFFWSQQFWRNLLLSAELACGSFPGDVNWRPSQHRIYSRIGGMKWKATSGPIPINSL
jgi:hypothetical protein